MNHHHLEASNQFDNGLAVMQGGTADAAAPLSLFPTNVAGHLQGAEIVPDSSSWMDQASLFGSNFNDSQGGMDGTAGTRFSPALALDTLRNGKLVVVKFRAHRVRTNEPSLMIL